MNKVIEWTVFQLMTDTVVIERDRELTADVWQRLDALEQRLEAMRIYGD